MTVVATERDHQSVDLAAFEEALGIADEEAAKAKQYRGQVRSETRHRLKSLRDALSRSLSAGETARARDVAAALRLIARADEHLHASEAREAASPLVIHDSPTATTATSEPFANRMASAIPKASSPVSGQPAA